MSGGLTSGITGGTMTGGFGAVRVGVSAGAVFGCSGAGTLGWEFSLGADFACPGVSAGGVEFSGPYFDFAETRGAWTCSLELSAGEGFGWPAAGGACSLET